MQSFDLVWKYLLHGKQWKSPSTFLSLLGMALGVACLVVAMAVVSGFRSTLEKTVIDVLGHMSVTRAGDLSETDLKVDVEPKIVGLKASAPFLNLKAIFAEKGKVNGVVIEGVDEARLKKVTRLQKLLVKGEFDLSPKEGHPGVLVGKELFQEAHLKIGDTLTLVIPLPRGVDATDFRSKLSRFTVRGVIHFGHYEFDTRYILMDLAAAQKFGEVKDKITGVRYLLKDSEAAFESKEKILKDLGYSYQVDTWRDYNKNLFEAADLEKVVIFFVLLIIVIAAAFNVSATLFVLVVRRYQDISILKTIGASAKEIRKIFIIFGLIIGALGSVAGIMLGYLLCLAFEFAQSHYGLILGSIYKIDHIDFRISILDSVAILGASLLICLLATLAPASRGSKLPPVEGLRYD
ncbi:MAG: ABC transporter permease [Bdellovibrionales bacterium]|nr:ABC transporter permease [Bdellovibrionales bacterium]